MRNPVLLTILFLASAGLATAQSASTPSPNNSQASSLPPGMSALTGCLQEKIGTYILVDEENTAHELSGSYGKLRHQVGHQIEVVGKPGIRNVDTTAPGGASGVIEKPIFQVKSVKQLADKCN